MRLAGYSTISRDGHHGVEGSGAPEIAQGLLPRRRTQAQESTRRRLPPEDPHGCAAARGALGGPFRRY